MPLLKTETFTVPSVSGPISEKIKINVNVNGEFYCNIPERLRDYFEACTTPNNCFAVQRRNSTPQIFSKDYEALKGAIYEALRVIAEPDITREPVILYNIESHVSFAEDEDGNVFPNARYSGAQWPANKGGDATRYGGHHAANAAEGGYSLTIGAKAMLKITKRLGDAEKVTYQRYYKDGTHLGHDNPAEKLNSWCSFTLPDKPKEIPYTDEAALFFHNLMLGMASLSKIIQDHTFDQDMLLKLIENGGRGLGMLPVPDTTDQLESADSSA